MAYLHGTIGVVQKVCKKRHRKESRILTPRIRVSRYVEGEFNKRMVKRMLQDVSKTQGWSEVMTDEEDEVDEDEEYEEYGERSSHPAATIF
jgi:hypothetical protein